MSDVPLICGFLKVRNEIIREGNIHRILADMKRYCDRIVICDDASTDGTRQFLEQYTGNKDILYVPANKQRFEDELFWKQKMMEIVHEIKPKWVFWMDGDETLDADADAFRKFCTEALDTENIAYRFHYTQLWRTKDWARTDSGFDEGSYIKLWRYTDGLSFEVKEGTHHFQFPRQIAAKLDGMGQSRFVPSAPFEIIHWGNYGKNLEWKCIQYYGGLGGVERHLSFENASFRPLNSDKAPPPVPYTEREKEIIRNFQGLRRRDNLFTVVIPTYNRAWALNEALISLLNQTYDKWIALVLDDGSTDNTAALMKEWFEKDPRIFYCQYEKMGAVAVNERGMDMACEFSEFWTRMGSDDYFGPNKLMNDFQAFRKHTAVYGPYQVLRDGKLAEICNPEMTPSHIKNVLTNGGFAVSWANIAVRTAVLKMVKEKYGNYCDPRLLNCEDFCVNSRIARVAEFTWRDGNDAIWRVSSDGASSNTTQTGIEERLTREIIAKENS